MGKSIIGDTLLSGGDDFSNAQVYLSFLGRRPGEERLGRVKGLMVGDFSISTGAAWSTPLNAAGLEGISTSLNVAKGLAETSAAKLGYNIDLGSQIQLKVLSQTTNFWTGSERPIFSIELLFISLNRGEDVRKEVMKLYQAVMPTRGEKLGVSFFLNAPLGYNPSTRAGTFSVQLGNWFRAYNQVMTSVQFTYSQEQVPLDGSKTSPATKFAPLYAKGSITFQPYQDITYGIFESYFMKV